MFTTTIKSTFSCEIELAINFVIDHERKRENLIEDNIKRIDEVNALSDKSEIVKNLNQAVSAHFPDANPTEIIQGGLLTKNPSSFHNYLQDFSKNLLNDQARICQEKFDEKYFNHQKERLGTQFLSTEFGQYYFEPKTCQSSPSASNHYTLNYDHSSELTARVKPTNDPVPQSVDDDTVGLEAFKNELILPYIDRLSFPTKTDVSIAYSTYITDNVIPQYHIGYSNIQDVLWGNMG